MPTGQSDGAHFLNWGFLFPDDTSLCQIYRKLASTVSRRLKNLNTLDVFLCIRCVKQALVLSWNRTFVVCSPCFLCLKLAIFPFYTRAFPLYSPPGGHICTINGTCEIEFRCLSPYLWHLIPFRVLSIAARLSLTWPTLWTVSGFFLTSAPLSCSSYTGFLSTSWLFSVCFWPRPFLLASSFLWTLASNTQNLGPFHFPSLSGSFIILLKIRTLHLLLTLCHIFFHNCLLSEHKLARHTRVQMYVFICNQDLLCSCSWPQSSTSPSLAVLILDLL